MERLPNFADKSVTVVLSAMVLTKKRKMKMKIYSQNLKIWLDDNTSHKNYHRIEKLSNSLFWVVE